MRYFFRYSLRFLYRSLFDSLARNKNKEMTPAKPPVKPVVKSEGNLMGITGKNNTFSQVCGAFNVLLTILDQFLKAGGYGFAAIFVTNRVPIFAILFLNIMFFLHYSLELDTTWVRRDESLVGLEVLTWKSRCCHGQPVVSSGNLSVFDVIDSKAREVACASTLILRPELRHQTSVAPYSFFFVFSIFFRKKLLYYDYQKHLTPKNHAFTLRYTLRMTGPVLIWVSLNFFSFLFLHG